jgi:PhzF family phenazine biosynthesis protein
MWMDFPSEPVTKLDPGSPEMPIIEEALDVAPVFVGRNRLDVLVEVDAESTVAGLAPDYGRLLKLEGRGIIVTARADVAKPYDFASRYFAPAFGIDEDPVTGSAHCALAPYWSDRIGKSELAGYQASKRTGMVRTRLEGDRVKLGGWAVTVFSGELRYPD